MATEDVTGLSIAEWVFVSVLTALTIGWAYFDNHTWDTGSYGEVDYILFCGLLIPGVFFFIKWGETGLKSRSQQALTNNGCVSVTKMKAEKGGESDTIDHLEPNDKDKSGIALPSLTYVRCGISRPAIGAISKIRYVVFPEQYSIELSGYVIVMADVDVYDSDSHDTLHPTIRKKIGLLPGVGLDLTPLMFGDNLESSWAEWDTKEKCFMIKKHRKSAYPVEDEQELNAHYVELELVNEKIVHSISRLTGGGLFG